MRAHNHNAALVESEEYIERSVIAVERASHSDAAEYTFRRVYL